MAQQRNAARVRFQSGEATVAVISDAASTGVSLHALPSGQGIKMRPRLHITLELNWCGLAVLSDAVFTVLSSSCTACTCEDSVFWMP